MQMLTNQDIDETKTFLEARAQEPRNEGAKDPRTKEQRNKPKSRTQGTKEPRTQESRNQGTNKRVVFILLARDARRARPNQEPKDQGAKKTMNQGSKEPMNVLAYMLIERYSTHRALHDCSFQCGCHKEGRLNNL